MGDADLAAQPPSSSARWQDAAPAAQTQSLPQEALKLPRAVEQASPSPQDATLAAESLAAAQWPATAR
jgi:hypothetical protein